MPVDWGSLVNRAADGAVVWGPPALAALPLAWKWWQGKSAEIFGRDVDLVRRALAAGARQALRDGLDGEAAIRAAQARALVAYPSVVAKHRMEATGKLWRMAGDAFADAQDAQAAVQVNQVPGGPAGAAA